MDYQPKSQILFHKKRSPQDFIKRTLGGASTRFKCCNFAAWYVTGKKNSFTDCYGPHFRLPTACNLLGPGCYSPAPLYYSGLERDNEGTSPPRSVIWDINTERLPQRLSHSIGCLLAHGTENVKHTTAIWVLYIELRNGL